MRKGLRRYQELAHELKILIQQKGYKVGDRILTERQIAEALNVGRSAAREAILMLEIEDLVEVRKGSGIYLVSDSNRLARPIVDDIGPFELLQARQLLESSIAGFAAVTVTKNDIVRMREALEMERKGIEAKNNDYSGDELFHRLIAEATQNSVLVDMVSELWRKRDQSLMWARLHERIFDTDYREQWLKDHEDILSALQLKDAEGARQAMWTHLENVRDTLMELSDVEDPHFDGYLFSNTAN
ncbi:FCD domain-containing protein [Natronospirillum operosum]|uniref:FCD domain-containing protein n=1 Tax=Natronospirillum operosum TaxID=2759953 RepID=A0A4Z0W6K9_9GAMM|nr:FCD domain-containing protein [Natronospirillum operosum]TGG92865.1 FCD domain-containing protein [Natronospirillum operosum]